MKKWFIWCVIVGFALMVAVGVAIKGDEKSVMPNTVQHTQPPTTTPPPASTTTPTPTTTTPPTSTTTLPRISDLFPDYEIEGKLKYAYGDLPKGYVGMVRCAKHLTFYYIYKEDGSIAKVPWDSLVLREVTNTTLPVACQSEIERAVKERGWQSETPYLLWTSLARLETYLFHFEGGKWTLVRRMKCSAGNLEHPTPADVYFVEQKIPYFGKEGAYRCMYATGFYGNYMYHSVLYDDKGEQIIDGRLGERISNGCIRLSTADSRFLYEEIPHRTAVYVQ